MKVSTFLTLFAENDHIFYLNGIIDNPKLRDKWVSFSHREMNYIAADFDFEIERIDFRYNERRDETEVYLTLCNTKDLTQILQLKQKRDDTIEYINQMLNEINEKMKKL